MSILSNFAQAVAKTVYGYGFTLTGKCGKVVINTIEKRRPT